ncbi:hypothetical protein [Planococcus shenhongbingii]|uniref:Uncharacterized protein n=1 Tax=Planococcus shenhongbingii TaxID=3058398 RepID=A0ABT8NCD7_9BACL|nr:hypothetical protein [Planococcus sp. N017]MDN7245552.1 hypothetical protein [Planococcus sp. N017]
MDILMNFPFGEPKRELLRSLFDHITRIFGSEGCTILWWYDPFYSGLPYNMKNTSKPHTRLISKNDMKFLQKLWEGIAGDYILFLPKDIDMKVEVEGEEEAIGLYLAKYAHLLLKTPDANEVLYLHIEE